MFRAKIGGMVLAALLILAVPPVFCGSVKPLYPGFPALNESAAYQQFKLRPVTDFSKLLFLIDRFGDANVEIVYDNHYFKTSFAAKMARWFITRNYKQETPEAFIMKWCNTSVTSGNLVWVKLPNNKFKLSREVLLNELKALEQYIAEEGLLKKKVISETPIIVSQVEKAIPDTPTVQQTSLTEEAAKAPALAS